MTIKPVSGFDFMGKVYPTREAAESAQTLHFASQTLRAAIENLGDRLRELYEANEGLSGSTRFNGMAEDMFPEHGEQSRPLIEALEMARDAYAEFKEAKA